MFVLIIQLPEIEIVLPVKHENVKVRDGGQKNITINSKNEWPWTKYNIKKIACLCQEHESQIARVVHMSLGLWWPDPADEGDQTVLRLPVELLLHRNLTRWNRSFVVNIEQLPAHKDLIAAPDFLSQILSSLDCGHVAVHADETTGRSPEHRAQKAQVTAIDSFAVQLVAQI